MTDYLFPPGFLWGTAAAGHQVEGDNRDSDWWDWEQLPGTVRGGDRSGLAADHYRRYAADFDLAAAMHNNAHRLGVEWARLERAPGQWNSEVVAHYRDVLQALRSRGLTPMVTLHHSVLPRWVAARGGWLNPETVGLFERYAAFVARELGDLVPLWCTVNEPVAYAYQAYAIGYWPPQKRSLGDALTVLKHLLSGHAAAYRAVHAARPDARVGIPHYMRVFDPANPASRLDRAVAGFRDGVFNRSVLDILDHGSTTLLPGLTVDLPEVRGTCDFLGVDYYHRDRIAFDLSKPGQAFGRELPPADREAGMPFWRSEIYSDGLRRIGMELAKYGKPIYITENGFLDNSDANRPAYIIRHLVALWQAIRDGAPVKGYFHWSLTDNFEWAEGYGARFGLVHVDFATQERTTKRSGRLYGEICAANGVTSAIIERYAPQLMSEQPPGGL